jgi:hypothetical protein
VSIHVCLREESLVRLKQRAVTAQVRWDDYLAKVLRYQLAGRQEDRARHPRPASGFEVHVGTRVSVKLREQLMAGAGRRAQNLAAFAGQLAEEFLDAAPRDPADLALVVYLSTLRETRERFTESDLEDGLSRLEPARLAGLPSAGRAAWCYDRLRRFVAEVQGTNGEVQPLNPRRVAELWERIQRAASSTVNPK